MSLEDIDVDQYQTVFQQEGPRPPVVVLRDYILGFDNNYRNRILDHLHSMPGPRTTIVWSNLIRPEVKANYTNFDFVFNHDMSESYLYEPLYGYTQHPDIDYQNFLCSFNGSGQVGRQLLTSALHKFGYANSVYVTKNFSYTIDHIDGHLSKYLTEDQARFYRKFAVTTCDKFANAKIELGNWEVDRFLHRSNIEVLAPLVTKSFIHLVSESWSHSYQPHITEKFMYSILTRGLFLSYAQPTWHQTIQNVFGYRLYTKIFDYSFDSIENPVERLVALLSMIEKFKMLSTDEWRDLYQIESDAIEFNYQHFMSGDCYKRLSDYTA